jgi:2-methylfumaryl-CoA isomerase
MQHETLKQKREDVISLHISGNPDGSTAVDYTVNSAAGFPMVTADGRADATVNGVIPAWDIATALHASTAILAAERHRRLTGSGQFIKIALSDVAFAVAGHLGYIGEVQINKAEREKTGNYLYGAFGRNFATRDGRQVMIIAISKKQWQGLCAATGIADKIGRIEELFEVDLNQDGDRFRSSEIIAALIEPWFKRHTLNEMRPLLNEHGVCWGPYQSFQQMVEEDPRVSEQNPMFQTVFQPGIGEYLMPGSPLNFSGFKRADVAPAPLLGQHTDEILSGYLGLSEQEIGRLHDDGIVAGPA